MSKRIYILFILASLLLSNITKEDVAVDYSLNKTNNFVLLDETIDPDIYVLGPGDELDFTMITSSAIINERLKVSYLGDIVISSVGKINVDKMTLTKAFSLITEKCNNKIQNSSVELTLSKIKDFKVLVLAPFNIPSGYFSISSSTRLLDLFNDLDRIYSESIDIYKKDIKHISSRNIIIETNYGINKIDLLSFKVNGNKKDNPYINPGDIIKLDYAKNNIDLHGAVMSPDIYEYKEGEKLSELILIAGGFKNNADLSNIEVTRYHSSIEKELIYLDRDSFSAFVLIPSDEVLIKPITDYKLKKYVTIKGEVKNPGRYTITENMTIKKIIERTGGYSQNADTTKITLNNEIINNMGDRELNRISVLDSDSRSDLDKSYMRARARSDRGGISNADFNVNSSWMSDYKLFDKDVINIPKKYNFIEVIGAIRNPGRYPFIPGERIDDYIEMAGGITGNSTNKYYIIQSGTGDRIHYKDFNGELNSQDIIFVEERNDYNSFDRFKDIIQIASQVLTILAVMNNLSP